MADLTAADITVTVQARNIEGAHKRNRVKLVFGDGAKTYPTGGVPLPSAATLGMVRNLDYVVLFDADDAQGIVWKYDKDNSKLRAYIQGLDLSAAGAGTLDDYPINTTNEPLASASVSVGLVGGAAAVKHLGRLKELINTQAPAATTVYIEAVGW